MTDDLTVDQQAQAEQLHKAIHSFARRRAFDRYARAVHLDVITEAQADKLMQMWDEDSPYEPLTPS